MTTLDDTTHFLTPVPSQSLSLVNEPAPPGGLTLREQIARACQAWLMKSPSPSTRSNYERDLKQFLAFAGIKGSQPEKLTAVRPEHVSKWRDHLLAQGRSNSSVRCKMTAVRSLFSYLQKYGYTGTNPAHGDFVAVPAIPRAGKTVALSTEACRLLLDAPVVASTRKREDGTEEAIALPVGVRDRAIFAILAYTGCRVGEVVRLKVASYKSDGVHKVLEIHGKGGKECLVPLHKEAEERLDAWLDVAGIRDNFAGALFRPTRADWGRDRQRFHPNP